METTVFYWTGIDNYDGWHFLAVFDVGGMAFARVEKLEV